MALVGMAALESDPLRRHALLLILLDNSDSDIADYASVELDRLNYDHDMIQIHSMVRQIIKTL